VTAETWVTEPPRGARFDRHMRFLGDDGRVRVEAKTTWAIVDRETARILRVPPEVAAPFLAG
jgi:acyl-CoA thioester hydrolase